MNKNAEFSNNIIRKAFEVAIKDEEWTYRLLSEWNALFEEIDKVLEYVNNDYKGELRVNDNIWWVLEEALCKVLDLYNLQIEDTEYVNEEALVIWKDTSVNNVKKKIFDKMEEYGWTFDDDLADSIDEKNENRFKSFLAIYNIHYGYIEELYEYLTDKENNGVDKETTLKNIDIVDLKLMIDFMSDFLRAFNEIR